jgi:hypothetical protein
MLMLELRDRVVQFPDMSSLMLMLDPSPQTFGRVPYVKPTEDPRA